MLWVQGVRSTAAGCWHTVALTDEEVYSWGSNTGGQLGNRTFRSSRLASEVVDLTGRGVIQVAAGSEHTLFVCRDGTVYGCGSNAHGQLPVAELDPATSLSVEDAETGKSSVLIAAPTLLRLGFLEGTQGARAPVVSQAIAGEHCSAFLTRAAEELPNQQAPRLWERLQAAVEAAREAPNIEAEAHVRPISAAVERIFSSAAAISAAFGIKDKVGLDVALLEHMQRSISELEPAAAAKKDDPQPSQDTLFQAFRKAMEVLVMDLERNFKLLGTPERAQVLLAALQSHLLGDSRCANTLIPRICNLVLQAPSSTRHVSGGCAWGDWLAAAVCVRARVCLYAGPLPWRCLLRQLSPRCLTRPLPLPALQLLVKWWAEYPGELLELRVVRPLHKYLTDELYATKKLTISVMNVIKVLAKVEEANQLGRQLPPEAFYNELIRWGWGCMLPGLHTAMS